MLFNSITYLLFLVLVLTLYWNLKLRARIVLLFIASVAFYGFWRFEFLSLLLLSAINDYWFSILISIRHISPPRQILFLKDGSISWPA